MNSWSNKGLQRSLAIFLLLMVLFSTNKTSETQAATLGGYSPEATQKRYEQDRQNQQKEKKYIETTPQEVNKEAIKDAKRDIKVGDYIYNPKFKLKKINFNGNLIYGDKILSNLAKDLLDKTVYMEDILNLTVLISRFYQSHGYLTCHAYIPPQEVTDGIIQINIIESKISKISIKGNKWAKNSYLEKSILGSNIVSGKIFNAKKLQGSLRELNKQDYIKGQVEISKTTDELTEIVLDIEDRMPISFDIVWDNYGRKLTGRQRGNLILGYDNITGRGDKIYAGTTLATGTTGTVAGYEIPAGKNGTKLSFDYGYSGIKLGKQYKTDNITGYSHNYTFKITRPLYRSADSELVFNSAFNSLKTKTKYNAINNILSDYNLHVFRTGLSGMKDDRYGRWIGSLGADFGARFLNATKVGPDNQESAFFKYSANAIRVHRLPKRSLGILRLNGQYSPNRLFAAEQMQLGGPYSVRGYEPGVILGDWGISGTAEIRTPIPYLTAILPEKIEHWENKIKFTTFYDWGYVKEHDNIYNYPRNFLHSIGCGLHCNLTDYISADFNIGMPLGGKHYGENDVRFNFSINSEVDKAFFRSTEKL